MARPYILDPSTITPGFPGSVFTPWPALDRKTDHPQRGENVTWRYATNSDTTPLDAGSLAQLPVAIAGAGAELWPVRWTESPDAGDVSVHHKTRRLGCHAS